MLADQAVEIEVCLAALVFYPRYSGPSMRFKRYAPGFRARGINLRVFANLWDDNPNAAGRSDGAEKDGSVPRYNVDGIPVHGLQVVPDRSWRQLVASHTRALARFCAQRNERPNVVQLLDISPWSMRGLLALRRTGIPLVYTHSMIEPSGSGLKEMLLRYYKLLPYHLVQCVVVSSDVMRDDLREAGVRGRIEIIPNGVDLQRFCRIDPAARTVQRQRLELDPESELIVFVGGFLSKRKGIDLLADAWGQIAWNRPHAQLVLVGPHLNDLRPTGRQSAFLQQVTARLAESGAEDRVVFTGEVENVEQYLQVADVFVFPSRLEGMPNVVLEAFGCGAPAVLTPFIGLPAEFGRAGEHYVLAERNPEALGAAIIGLLDNPERRARLAGQARAWVERNLDVEHSLDRYAALYRELAARASKK